MKSPESISVFFLAYNDEKTIGELVRKASVLLKDMGLLHEIIVGNDASTDNTLEVLQSLKREIPELKILNNQTNLGYGGNLISGLKEARMEFVFYTDGDGQYNPNELKKLINALDENVDVVNGYKQKRGDNIFRVVMGLVYARWVRFIFQIKIKDTDCDFRLIRRSLIDKISLESTSGAICPELVIKLQRAGARFVEVPVSHYPRKYGRSQFMTLKRVLSTFRDEYSLLKTFHYGKFRKLKFVTVGCSSLTVQLTFFNIFMLFFKINPTLSTLLSDEISIFSSFYLNNALTFKDRKIHRKDGLGKIIKSFLKYNYITLAATLIQTGTVYLGTKFISTSYLFIHFLFLFGILMGMVWNYKLHNLYVWPKNINGYEKRRI